MPPAFSGGAGRWETDVVVSERERRLAAPALAARAARPGVERRGVRRRGFLGGAGMLAPQARRRGLASAARPARARTQLAWRRRSSASRDRGRPIRDRRVEVASRTGRRASRRRAAWQGRSAGAWRPRRRGGAGPRANGPPPCVGRLARGRPRLAEACWCGPRSPAAARGVSPTGRPVRGCCRRQARAGAASEADDRRALVVNAGRPGRGAARRPSTHPSRPCRTARRFDVAPAICRPCRLTRGNWSSDPTPADSGSTASASGSTGVTAAGLRTVLGTS